MAKKPPTPEEVKAKLYAIRRTDYGYHGKFTERAVTGGYTIQPRDIEIVRDHDKPVRVNGRMVFPEAKHTTFKAPRGSARPHGGINRDIAAAENGMLRTVQKDLGDWFQTRKDKRRQANTNRRNRLSRQK